MKAVPARAVDPSMMMSRRMSTMVMGAVVCLGCGPVIDAADEAGDAGDAMEAADDAGLGEPCEASSDCDPSFGCIAGESPTCQRLCETNDDCERGSNCEEYLTVIDGEVDSDSAELICTPED